jgi:hypothetical protein
MPHPFAHIDWSAPREKLIEALRIHVHDDYVGYAAWSRLQDDPEPDSASVWVHAFSKADAIEELLYQLHDRFAEVEA